LVCNNDTTRFEWTDGSAVDYRPAVYDPLLDDDCISDPEWTWDIHPDGSWGVGHSTTTVAPDICCKIQLPPLPTPSDDGCENFEDDSDDGVCYQIAAPAENFQEAQAICRSFGSNLASIHNPQENTFIRRLAISNGHVKGMFLGATVSGKGNDFAWVDGSDWDYSNFNPGFPMKGLGDCLAMDTEGTSGQWVNTDCNSKLSVACMRSQTYTAPGCTSGVYREGEIVIFVEANSCCDHLLLFDNFVAGDLIANLSGEVYSKTYSTSSSNIVKVSWQPNGGVNVKGLMVK
ncbi:hypothetical protein PMAYCL1PPCAC_21384, partial [Pristionchus mayeri]